MIYHPIGHAVSQEPIDLTHEQKRRPRDRVYRGARDVRAVPNMAIFDISRQMSRCSSTVPAC